MNFSISYNVDSSLSELEVSLNLIINNEMFKLTFLTNNQTILNNLGDFIVEGSFNNNVFTNVNNNYTLEKLVIPINILVIIH